MEPSYLPERRLAQGQFRLAFTLIGHNYGVAPGNELIEVIRDEIRSQGPLTFARYMDLALYHPELGFYRTRDRFGVRGDFYTAEQLQPVFGELIGSYVEKLTKQRVLTDPYDGVLELGAGRAEMREALSQWGYRAFEWGSPGLPAQWSGLVLANEFFDALPVHLLRRGKKGWRELRVATANGDLCFLAEAPSNPALRFYAEEFGEAVAEGDCLEACLAVNEWCSRIAGFLREGRLLVIDYGYEMRELLRFPSGSLLTFSNHRAGTDVLANPGRRDITAHVNFAWLRSAAASAGLRHVNSSALSTWVFSTWPEEALRQRWEDADQGWRLQWKHLVFGLGETFKVLEFER